MVKNYKTSAYHKPELKNLGQWVGVEIECFIPFNNLIKETAYTDSYNLTSYFYNIGDARKKLARLMKKNDIPNITIKGDGSISSPDESLYLEVEMALLYKRTDRGPLKRLCELLNSLNAQVNNSCGLHVHLDCRDVLYRNEDNRWEVTSKANKRGEKIANALPLMLKMVSKSRRNNGFCKPIMSTNRTAINLSALTKHGTIEVRLHQGTTSYEKIANWVDFLYNVSRAKKQMRVTNVKQLKNYLGKPIKKLSEYIEKRVKEFKD